MAGSVGLGSTVGVHELALERSTGNLERFTGNLERFTGNLRD